MHFMQVWMDRSEMTKTNVLQPKDYRWAYLGQEPCAVQPPKAEEDYKFISHKNYIAVTTVTAILFSDNQTFI